MLKEFKEFALKGNVLDMAVGVIIGGAFGKIVSSVVNDLIMPIFGFLTAGMDFNKLKFILSPPKLAENGTVIKAEAAIMYGSFIQNVIDFLLISISIFMFIRILNKFRRKKEVIETIEEKKQDSPTEVELLTQIRDFLKNAEK